MILHRLVFWIKNRRKMHEWSLLLIKDYITTVQEMRCYSVNQAVGFVKTIVSNKHKFLTLGIQLDASRIRDPNKSKEAKNLQVT